MSATAEAMGHPSSPGFPTSLLTNDDIAGGLLDGPSGMVLSNLDYGTFVSPNAGMGSTDVALPMQNMQRMWH